jgi:hypothetical protein
MGRSSKKVVTGGSKDNPPITSEDQGLEKEAPQDPNTSNANKEEERRLKDLQDQLQAKHKELEECRASVREKLLK